MKASNDSLWYQAAPIPPTLGYGIVSLADQWGRWVLMAGLMCMFAYITRLHRRLAKLEERLPRQ